MNKSINKIKTRITSKDLILTGTVRKAFKQCGKQNCRCKKEKSQWHGPYWIWTRKVDNKTVTRTLKKEQVAPIKKAIKEMKQLNSIIEKWKVQSLKEIEK